MAAVPVVRFQNIPNTNTTNTPGLIKPVYFWINVNPPAPPMPKISSQVNSTLIHIAQITTHLPIHTNFSSLASLAKYFL